MDVPKILLVEDIPLVRDIHLEMLQELGCNVEVAENGCQAIDMLKNNYDIIFLDIGLPDISGIEVARKMRQDTNGKTCGIVALTAYTHKETLAECLAAGMDMVETKPTNRERLSKIIKIYLPNAVLRK